MTDKKLENGKLPRWDARTQEESNQYGIGKFDPSKTKEEFAKDNDPQEIVNRFTKTGQLPSNLKTPFYGDLTGVPTYQQALEIVSRGREAFMSLPAQTRKFFDNDPHKFIQFVDDPKNIEEGEKLGLWTIRKEEPEKVQKVQIVTAEDQTKK